MTTKRWHIDKCFFREKVSFVIINVKPDFWNERRWYSSLIPSCCWLAALYFFDMAEIELFRHFLLPWWDPFCSHSYKYFPKCDTFLQHFSSFWYPLEKVKIPPRALMKAVFSMLLMLLVNWRCTFWTKNWCIVFSSSNWNGTASSRLLWSSFPE